MAQTLVGGKGVDRSNEAADVPAVGEIQPSGPIDALKVFISYSRRDLAAAEALVAALEAQGFDAKIDRRDLPYGEEWQKELAGFIAESDTVIWLVSPDSVKSDWCNWELGEVGRLSKRLVPVKVRDIDAATLPRALGRIHLLPVDGVYDPAKHEADLVRTLNTDRAWLKQGTLLGDDAREWVRSNRDRARLLRGAALSDAESWSLRPPREAPPAPSEVLEYILASRAAQRRGWRFAIGGALAVATIGIGLAVTAFLFQREAERQTEVAEQEKTVAVRNDTLGLISMSRESYSDSLTTSSLKLALAAWPRAGDEDRPEFKRAIQSLSEALPDAREQAVMHGVGVGHIASLEFSPDGGTLLSASRDGSVRMWDAMNGQLVRVIFVDFAEFAKFSPDGQHIIVAAPGRPTTLWSAATGLMEATFERPSSQGVAADFSPDGRTLVTGSSDGVAVVWDVATRKVLHLLQPGKRGEVFVTRYSALGKKVLVGTLEGTVTLWDVSSTQPPTAMTTVHVAQRLQNAFLSMDEKEIVVVSPNGQVSRYDAKTSRPLDSYRMIAETTGSAMLPDGRHVIVGGRVAQVWDIARKTVVMRLAGHDAIISAIAISSDGMHFATASGDETIRLWDRRLGNVVAEVPMASAAVEAIAFAPDGATFVTGTSDGTAQLRDARTGMELRRFIGHDRRIGCVSISPNGELLLTASDDRTAKLWDIRTGLLLHTFPSWGERQAAVARFSPDGRWIALPSSSGGVELWDAASREKQTTFGSDNIFSLAFSPDGSRMVITISGNDGAIWDLRSGQLLATLDFDDERAYHRAAFTPDGQTIISIDDKEISKWNAQSGRFIYAQPWPGSPYSDLPNFSADGSRMAVLSARGVYVLDVKTGIALVHAVAPIMWSRVAGISPDGRTVVGAVNDGFVRIWDISTLEKGDGLQVACQRLGNNTSLRDVQERYGLGEMTPICGDNAPMPVDWSKLQ